MSNVAVAERPASVTVGNVTVTSQMSATERYNAIARAQGAPEYKPSSETLGPAGPTEATLRRMAQGDAEAARQLPREDGQAPATLVLASQEGVTALGQWYNALPPGEQSKAKQGYIAAHRALQAGGWLERTAKGELVAHTADEPRPGQHAGQVAPSPQELERLNAFDQEMRDKGLMLPAPIEDGRFVRDEHTGVVFDSHAIAQCNKIWRDMPAAERTDDARAEYEATLADIYAGKLQLADMQGSDAPRVEQPRDDKGRYSAPAQATGWQSHIEDGQWVGLEHLTTADTSGYTIPQYIPDQRLNVSTFELLKSARAAGISQAQVNAVFHQDAIKNGWRKA